MPYINPAISVTFVLFLKKPVKPKEHLSCMLEVGCTMNKKLSRS